MPFMVRVFCIKVWCVLSDGVFLPERLSCWRDYFFPETWPCPTPVRLSFLQYVSFVFLTMVQSSEPWKLYVYGERVRAHS